MASYFVLAAESDVMAKVVYITGYGRSGSTAIATVIGGHESVISVGEISNVARVCGSEDEYCACGTIGSKCEFWSRVREKWEELAGVGSLNDWARLQERYERKSAIVHLLMVSRILRKSASFQKYSSGVSALYEAISIVSGRQYILDSSKDPVRALALSMNPGVELSVIHLLRDPRGVAHSLSRSWEANPKGGIQKPIRSAHPLVTVVKWWLVNMMAEFVKLRLARDCSLTIRYEDFVASPSGFLEQIGNLTRLDFADVIGRLSARADFSTGHTVAGNRLRMSKAIRLRAENEARDWVGADFGLFFRLVAGALAAPYGYRLGLEKNKMGVSTLPREVRRRRNVLLAVSSLESGGAERVATTLCNAWAQRGDAVTLLATFSGRGHCFYPVSDSVKVIYLADVIKDSRKSIITDVNRLRAIRRVVIDLQPDVVVSFLTNVNLAMILATRWLGVPVIACERTNPYMHQLPSGMTLLRRLLYPRAAMVTVQTEDLALKLGSNWREVRRVAAVSNPVPQDLLIEYKARPRSSSSRRRLVAMGRLAKEKQFEMLLGVFAELAKEFHDWDLRIYGDGPLKQALESRVASLGLHERVELPGNTLTPWHEMSQSEVFVLCSSYEGFPNVLLEAMAVGLPCVSFDCPTGPRDISRNGIDAMLVTQGDWAALAAALRQLMGDESLRQELGRKARASVVARYSVETIMKDWDRLFDEVSKERVD